VARSSDLASCKPEVTNPNPIPNHKDHNLTILILTLMLIQTQSCPVS